MSLYKRLFVFIMVGFCLSCSQNSKKMIEPYSLDKPPNDERQAAERLSREKHFNFTDGISKAEALYFAQNYCIKTHKNEYLNIYNPRIKEEDGIWSISYRVLPKTLVESIRAPSLDMSSKLMPFIMMIDKKTGKASIVIYKLNSRTKKIEVSIEKLTYSL